MVANRAITLSVFPSELVMNLNDPMAVSARSVGRIQDSNLSNLCSPPSAAAQFS
jgi:hypothetical protein